MEINIKTKGVDELQKRFALAPKIIQEEFTKSMTRLVLMGERSSKQKAPKWRNQLARSITSEVTPAAGQVKGQWGTNLAPHYGPDVEFGTKPHFVPWKYIGDWALAHGFKAPKDPSKGGLRVSGKKQPFIKPAYEEIKGKVGPEFKAATNRVITRLKAG